MKERKPGPSPLKDLSLEKLLAMDVLIHLYENEGQDVTDVRKFVWDAINEKLGGENDKGMG